MTLAVGAGETETDFVTWMVPAAEVGLVIDHPIVIDLDKGVEGIALLAEHQGELIIQRGGVDPPVMVLAQPVIQVAVDNNRCRLLK